MNTEEERLLRRISVNPKVMAGKPVIRGTRITVEQILRLLAQGLSPEEILRDFPHLTEEDLRAALLYASKVLEGEEIFPAAEAET